MSLRKRDDPMKEDPRRCNAKRRNGEPCRKYAIKGAARCRLHGGKSLKSFAHPSFKAGKHSKFLPQQLRRDYEATLQDPELLSLRDAIALTEARVVDLLQGLCSEGDDAGIWHDILDALEYGRRLRSSETKRLVAMQQYLSVEEALAFASAVAESVCRHVHDPAALRAIAADLAALTGRPADESVKQYQA
jgi:hypothetical protein